LVGWLVGCHYARGIKRRAVHWFAACRNVRSVAPDSLIDCVGGRARFSVLSRIISSVNPVGRRRRRALVLGTGWNDRPLCVGHNGSLRNSGALSYPDAIGRQVG